MNTRIEQYLIEQVRKKREDLGFSQLELSQMLGMSDSFISNVESQKRRAKYNSNHLNAIAKIFKCSPREFWPKEAI